MFNNYNFQQDVQSSLPLYKQIANRIREEVETGHLGPGVRMPAIRVLAQQLKVNRNTLARAYNYLVSVNVLSVRQGIGTFVGVPCNPNLLQGNRSQLMESPMGHMPAIRFDEDCPDPGLKLMKRLAGHYKRHFELSLKHYQTLNRHEEVKHLLLDTLQDRMSRVYGCYWERGQTTLIQGWRLAFFNIVKLLCGSGGSLVSAEPGEPEIWDIISSAGLKLRKVGITPDGIDLRKLEQICKKERVSAVYVRPRCHFPTTVCMSDENKTRLVDLAKRYHFMIIERDMEHEFYDPERPFIPLAVQNRDLPIVYLHHLSALLPFLTDMVMITGPKNFVSGLDVQSEILGGPADAVSLLCVNEAMKEGELAACTKGLWQKYKRRKDRMDQLMKKYLKDLAAYQKPPSGWAYWIKTKQKHDITGLVESLGQRGIFVQHPAVFNPGKKTPPAIRLCFAATKIDEMNEGLYKLANLLAMSYRLAKAEQQSG